MGDSGQTAIMFAIAAITILGTGGGRFITRYLRDRREQQARAQQPYCGCGHHYAFHNTETGMCKETDSREVFNGDGDQIGWEDIACRCQTYEGPISPSQYQAYLTSATKFSEIGD